MSAPLDLDALKAKAEAATDGDDNPWWRGYRIEALSASSVLALIERVKAAEADRDEWRDVSVGPAYATLLTEKLTAAEARLADALALADQWQSLDANEVDWQQAISDLRAAINPKGDS